MHGLMLFKRTVRTWSEEKIRSRYLRVSARKKLCIESLWVGRVAKTVSRLV
jgi:hypothetical protein